MIKNDVVIWPENQPVGEAGDPNIFLTHFTDVSEVNSALAETILRLERSSSHAEHLVRGSCGIKLHHVERWGSPEAQLLLERACALFRLVLRAREAHIDASWGNIYRNGDYCMPHSHIRAQASIVYMVDGGDENAKDRLAGKLCFADPRLPYCNQHEPGRLTRILVPDMPAGSMIMFPGATVHCVNPYAGRKPRITMSWNINAQALPGNPRQTFNMP
jgi:Putative 2OG-Fe(II) oxygenase